MDSIAVVIQNIIQYYSLKPLLKKLREDKWNFDIILYRGANQNGFEKISDEVRETIKKDGFLVYDKAPKRFYKICFAPYQNMVAANYKYLLGYCYGAAATKPSVTFQPEAKMKFHGILLHDTYGADLLSVYTKTYIVPDLYLKKVNRHPVSKKPVILYLPTYNEPCVDAVAKSLKELRKKYYVIIKGHHGIEHLNNEIATKNILLDAADEYYGSSQYAQQLLERADIVLSDNSGAIMDALYTNVPVCIAAQNINKKIADINTLQHDLVVKGVIPYSKRLDAESLDSLFQQTLTKELFEKQFKESDKLFPHKNGGVNSWIKIIQLYMDDMVSQNYCKLHDYYVARNELVGALQQKCDTLQQSLNDVVNELNIYKTSRFYKIANSIYKLKHP